MKKRKIRERIGAFILCIASAMYFMGNLSFTKDVITIEADAATYTYDQDFEDYLTEQGFPDSYKDALRQMHADHPNWVFEAFETGLDWDTVIENEMTFKRNLVPDTSSYPSSYKDTTISGSYDWVNDEWIVLSSPYWVQASQAIVEYYMDPRNFLTEEYVFQFELETYNADVQNLEGVEKILEGTFMSNTVVEGADVEDDNEYILSDTYTVKEKYLYGLSYKTTVKTLLSGLSYADDDDSEMTLQVVDSDGVKKTSSQYVGTGDKVQLVAPNGKTVLATCTVVLFGDLDGDGQVNSMDRAYLKMYIQGKYTLSAAQKKAADVNQDDSVNSVDRAYVKMQVNSKYTIEQSYQEAMTYGEVFMEIAAEVNVSPYTLASRVRQEQGVSGTSSLISGTVEGYEGYYNYFNIQANGTTTEEIITNGLNEAVAEGWNTRYKSLLGGATKISENYISKGQDTLYLQKFDVDSTYYSLYWHQYMQNLLAATNEGYNVYLAYVDLDALDEAFVFKIPVYENMPSSACAKPTADGNPNYKLESLSITNYTIDFDSDVYDYYISVPKSVSKLTISASAYASTTSISGTGTVKITSSATLINVKTTAENGDTATYRIHLNRT